MCWHLPISLYRALMNNPLASLASVNSRGIPLLRDASYHHLTRGYSNQVGAALVAGARNPTLPHTQPRPGTPNQASG
jgi:hypothetical protein